MPLRACGAGPQPSATLQQQQQHNKMNITIKRGVRLTCARAAAQAPVYRKIVARNGKVWLVPKGPFAAERVHVHAPKDTKSAGYGGAVLDFPLEDGSVYKAKGPRHSNADSLFEYTGVDVRDTVRTRVILAKGREFDAQDNPVLTDVVYNEDVPMEGPYNRYVTLIKRYPEATHYYMESAGGSSCGLTENHRD